MFRKLNLKNRYLVLIMIAALIVSVLLIFLFYKSYINQPLFLVFMFIAIFTFTSASSAMMNKAITNRLARKKRGQKYEYNLAKIDKEKFDDYQKLNYGDFYLKTINKSLYTLTVVSDSGLYFSEDADPQKVNTKNISKAVQFYIFMEEDFKLEPTKIQMLNYQAKKFYLQTFIYDEAKQTLTETEKLEPSVEFSDNVLKMFELINIEK